MLFFPPSKRFFTCVYYLDTRPSSSLILEDFVKIFGQPVWQCPKAETWTAALPFFQRKRQGGWVSDFWVRQTSKVLAMWSVSSTHWPAVDVTKLVKTSYVEMGSCDFHWHPRRLPSWHAVASFAYIEIRTGGAILVAGSSGKYPMYTWPKIQHSLSTLLGNKES